MDKTISYAEMRRRANERDREYDRLHPESARACQSRYSKTHSVERRILAHRRNAIKRNAPGRGITANQFKALLKSANNVCEYCNAHTEKLTLDHKHPLSKGGAHDIDNAAAVCARCNSSKGSKLLYEEWIPPKDRNSETT